MILYVGYQLEKLDITKILEPFIGELVHLLPDEIFTVHFYHTKCGQKDMLTWYNTDQDVVHIGHVERIFALNGKKSKIVVAELRIYPSTIINSEAYSKLNPKIYFMILLNNSKISPQIVKNMASTGQLGKPIELGYELNLNFKKIIKYGEMRPVYYRNRDCDDYSWL